MAQPSSAYEPRDPTSSALYAIVRDHFETFRAHAASLRDGDGLPRFVEQEFRDFLRCGCLAGGFARFRCVACGQDRLVAFSCKGRGFCPRCGGRLEKDRARRYDSGAEVLSALKTARTPSTSGAPQVHVQTAVAARASPSIAVLPFADMSPAKDQEWFGDGLAEEIINALAHVRGLKVIARTSAFAFKGKHEDVRHIAQVLNVDHVLEGSVRRAGNRIRVTAQLIGAADGSHLWSERFDRELEDVFAVEDEIAQSVATTLRVQLMPLHQRRRYTPTLPAFEAVLKGLHQSAKDTPESMNRATGPETRLFFVFFHLLPLRRLNEAFEQARHMLSEDPVNVRSRETLSACMRASGQYEEAIAESRHLVELHENYWLPHMLLALPYIGLERFGEALPPAERAWALAPWSPHTIGVLAGLLWRIGETSRAEELIRTLPADKYKTPTALAIFHSVCGEIDKAADAFEKAIEQRASHHWPRLAKLMKLPQESAD